VNGIRDDDLTRFEAHGAAPLPDADQHGHVEHEGARIWYASYGSGAPVAARRPRPRRQLGLPGSGQFEAFVAAVSLMMKSQPNYSALDLARIAVPTAIVHAEHDEFIRRDHAEYLARTIPGASWVLLPGVSHFAPLQRPERFNDAMLDFLGAAGTSASV
jgi:pimeloyl-ACP methyl ester carboxylesterase